MLKKKTGRNELCPCKSGNKFKRCCGLIKPEHMDLSASNSELQMLMRQAEAKEKQRISQQGYGYPIVSFETNGYRVVAVGNVLS